MNIINFFSLNNKTNIPNTSEISTIEELKTNGYASIIFKVLLSKTVIVTTVVAMKALINYSHFVMALTVGAIGVFILLKIINYTVGLKVTYKDRQVNEGTFKDGFLVKGKKVFSNGNIQEGTFDNEWLIEGKATFTTGSVYEGTFKEEVLVKGRKVFLDGQIKEGTFNKAGLLIEGKVTYIDGSVSEGNFND